MRGGRWPGGRCPESAEQIRGGGDLEGGAGGKAGSCGGGGGLGGRGNWSDVRSLERRVGSCARECATSLNQADCFCGEGGRHNFMFSAGRPFVLKDLRIPLPRFKDLILLFSLVWLLMPPKPFILLQRAMPRIGASRAESVKGGLKLGKTIAAGHQSYNLMLALQLGLR